MRASSRPQVDPHLEQYGISPLNNLGNNSHCHRAFVPTSLGITDRAIFLQDYVYYVLIALEEEKKSKELLRFSYRHLTNSLCISASSSRLLQKSSLHFFALFVVTHDQNWELNGLFTTRFRDQFLRSVGERALRFVLRWFPPDKEHPTQPRKWWFGNQKLGFCQSSRLIFDLWGDGPTQFDE